MDDNDEMWATGADHRTGWNKTFKSGTYRGMLCGLFCAIIRNRLYHRQSKECPSQTCVSFSLGHRHYRIDVTASTVERKTGGLASAGACPGACKEVSLKSSNAHSIRLTCKVGGAVRKEERHPQRHDPATHTDHRRSNAHTRKTYCTDCGTVIDSVPHEIFNATEATRSDSSNHNEEQADRVSRDTMITKEQIDLATGRMLKQISRLSDGDYEQSMMVQLFLDCVMDFVERRNGQAHHERHVASSWRTLTRQLGSSREPSVPRPFGEISGAPLLHPKRVCNYIHPKQHGPFPDRLTRKTSHSYEMVLLRGWKQISTLFWKRRALDIRKAHTEFREASVRKHDTSYQECHFDNNVPNRSLVQNKAQQKTTRIQNPDVEEKALSRSESQASDTSSHCRKRLSMLTTSFSRIGPRDLLWKRCAVLFNKDTFFPDIKVKSIKLHDIWHVLLDKVCEGDSGWVIQGFTSRASLRQNPPQWCLSTSTTILPKNAASGRSCSLLSALWCLKNTWTRLLGIFNLAAWRRDTSANSISIIEEAFVDCALPMPPGPTPLWGPGAVPGGWADVYGFLKPPDSNERWRVRQNGACPVHHEALGIRQTDQSCHP